jgi:hypothetical protein
MADIEKNNFKIEDFVSNLFKIIQINVMWFYINSKFCIKIL